MNPNTSNPGPGLSLPPCTSHYGRSPSSTALPVPEWDEHYYSLTSFYDSLLHATNHRTMQAPFSSTFNLVSQESVLVPGSNSFPFVNMCPHKCLMFHRWILPQFVFPLLIIHFLVLPSVIIKIWILFYMHHFLCVHLCLQLVFLIIPWFLHTRQLQW